eukprot:SAG11_NODE_11490_length_757_cov_1.047112_1_plen_32_part_01
MWLSLVVDKEKDVLRVLARRDGNMRWAAGFYA